MIPPNYRRICDICMEGAILICRRERGEVEKSLEMRRVEVAFLGKKWGWGLEIGEDF